tara:strand:- start:765 stop:1472 length:708 start_codon:yes stop_codon:yes gene_type:complete
MARFTRTVSSSGEAVGDTAKKYEWELIANCCYWECCYSGTLDVKVDPSQFQAFKAVMNGMATNCSGSSNVWVLPKYHLGDSAYCNYWCCNSYNWMRPGCFNGCGGLTMCYYSGTSACHPTLFSCCSQCVPNKLVGCIMSGNVANFASGIHGEMCLSQGCQPEDRLNMAYMYACWKKNAGGAGGCWKCLEVVSIYSSLGFVGPRWNNGQTCGWGGQIPSWQVYGIRCQPDMDSTLV